MCLTEPHCGTDLGLLKTKAEPARDDGSFTITGTKIFITSGEHDVAENILHLVLARLPDAPDRQQGNLVFSSYRNSSRMLQVKSANATRSLPARSNTRWGFTGMLPA